MSKVNGKLVKRYLKGLPVNGLLEVEESFLVNNWKKGAKLYRLNSSSDTVVEELEEFNIPALAYPKTSSWNVDRPWEYPYLILVSPMAEIICEEVINDLKKAPKGGWAWFRPAERLTATWEWEFRNGSDI